MKCAIDGQVVLLRAPEGPLVAYIKPFAGSLRKQGYAPETIHRQVLLTACFSRWLKQQGVALRSIAGDHLPRYLRYRARRVRPSRGDAAALCHLLAFLRIEGAIPAEKISAPRLNPAEPYGDNVLTDWYAGMPPYTVTPLEGIRNKVGPYVRVRYAPDNNINNYASSLAAESDVAIVFVGNHPTCNDRFGRCASPSEGKEAVDRKTIDLDPQQLNLIRRVKAANGKTIVALVSSFPFAIGWVQDNVSAILQMAHSSQEEGNALADVLFGDYNPGGRLVATWVRSLDDLPPMMDYNTRDGRTYMYFKGQPLYPFGFGLSYTRFDYSNLRTSADSLDVAGQIVVSVDVRNTGTRMGDEVVQMYVRHLNSAVERPLKELRGFQRIPLRPGETQAVQFTLKGTDLTYWKAERHAFVVEPGQVGIMVGASSADIRLKKTIEVKGE